MQTLARICIGRPVFAVMLAVSLVVVGLFSFATLGVDLLPKIDIPVVTVMIANPGASPQEIESEITRKVEDAVSTVGGIEHMKSTSVEGVSLTIITFELEKDGNLAAQEVRDRVGVITGLPAGARPAVIRKADAGAAPILQLALSAPRPLEEVTHTAEERVQKALQSIAGVGQVEVLGGASSEVRVTVNPEAMQALGVTVGEVIHALQAQNIEVPAGRLNGAGREWTVRTMGRLTGIEQLARIAVAKRGEHVIQLRELAAVTLSDAEQRTASLLNGKRAVTIQIAKQSDENTVEVATAVKKKLKQVQASLDPSYKLEIVSDQSVFIEAAVETIEEHLISGTLLAGLIVWLFLGSLRSTLIAAIAIPVSLIATFAMMSVVGYTLNQVTMLALALMIGIVIDDAIVVLENIYRFVEEKGMDAARAASEATREIGLAVTATTLSLMAVFLPIGFMKGMVGRIMSSFGLTSAFAVGVSLFVSFSLTPMLCARLIRRKADSPARPGAESGSHFYRAIESRYMAMLDWSMANRWKVVALCVAVLLSTVPLMMMVRKNFTPTDDQSAFQVSLRAGEGATLEATALVSERIAGQLRTMPGVVTTLVTIGGAADQQVNTASILVKLAAISDRRESQEELINRARGLLTGYPRDLRLVVTPLGITANSGSGSADIQYIIRGADLARLEQYSNELAKLMAEVPGTTDVESSLVTGKPSVFVEIDRERAADLGVSAADIAQTLNALVASVEVSTLETDGRSLPVRVQARADYLTSAEGLRRMSIASPTSGLVPLDNLARVTPSSGPSAIERQDRLRAVTVTANLKSGASQAGVIAAINEKLKTIPMAPGYVAGPAGASEELGKAAVYFLIAVALSFVFMYLVLASQFESFVQPLIILSTLPLSVPCGVLSLLATGQSFNLFAALGLLLLFGVVKKNAILQMDHANTLRAQGMERNAAIVQANRDRLRPILMTTMALVAGMAPLVISSGPGAGTNRSIGVVVMGGQSLCLLLTLLAVPVFYSLVDDLRQWHVLDRIVSRWAPRALPETSR